MFVVLFLFIIMIAVAMSTLVIVPQGFAYVTEVLGKYHSTWYAGPHFRIPFFERVARRVNVKEQVGDFAAIEAITKSYKVKIVFDEPAAAQPAPEAPQS